METISSAILLLFVLMQGVSNVCCAAKLAQGGDPQRITMEDIFKF